MQNNQYKEEESPIPRYEISKELKDLVMMFVVSSIIYFVIAGSLAIVMRVIQSKIMLVAGNQQQTAGLFYAALTVHGQLMFFGFASMLVLGISYYLLSKFAKKPLRSMKVAIWSFATMNAGAILLIISGTMFFGGGWYDLMPLPFHPGNGGWSTLAAATFLSADALIGVSLTLFSLNVISTVLTGKIAAGVQRSEQDYSSHHKATSDLEDNADSQQPTPDRGSTDYLEQMNLPAAVRWLSVLGIAAWLPERKRRQLPAVSIVVVGVFVNAVAQLLGNIGLFIQLANGFSYLTNPSFQINWLLTKDAWWFFGHPIVYFTLFSFLGAAYYFIPRYARKVVPYDRWAYRPWPFYLIFTMGVFSHHLYEDLPNPIWLQTFAQVSSFGIVFPSGLTIMTIMMYIFRSRIRWNITSMFIVAGIAGWAFGGFTGVETGWWGTNIYLHNTLNVVGHIHLVLLMGSVLFALGIIYSVIPEITKKKLNKTLGNIHLALTVVGGFGLALMFTYLGFSGFIRREAVIPDEFSWALPWLLFFAVTVGIGQLVFVYNLFATIAKRRRLADGVVSAAGQETTYTANVAPDQNRINISNADQDTFARTDTEA